MTNSRNTPVEAFEQAYGRYRDTPGEDLTDPQARELEAAAVLYRGDLIETWYQVGFDGSLLGS